MSYQHLSTYERGCIETLYKLGYSNRKIALELGRHHSTIDRELTRNEVKNYPQLKMAQGERDIGVIVSFNTEAEDIKTSLLVPDMTLGINPLN